MRVACRLRRSLLAAAAVLGAAAAGCGGNGGATSPAANDPLAPVPDLPAVTPAEPPAALPGEARWETYATSIKDTPARITVDTAASAPDASRPLLLAVMVDMLEPGPQGLEDQDARSQLPQIATLIQQRLAPALSAHYVGSVTRNGTVEFYLYLPAGVDADGAIAGAEQLFSRHTWLPYPQDDPEWETYRQLLLPTAKDLERVRNRRAIEQLAAQGDVHGRARPVDHFCSFPAHTNAKAFAKAVLQAGYEPLLLDPSAQSDPARPFGVRVRHVDAVTLDRITEVSLQLRRLAGDHFGAYDTWGAPVVK
jgi:hypothetical protein